MARLAASPGRWVAAAKVLDVRQSTTRLGGLAFFYKIEPLGGGMSVGDSSEAVSFLDKNAPATQGAMVAKGDWVEASLSRSGKWLRMESVRVLSSEERSAVEKAGQTQELVSAALIDSEINHNAKGANQLTDLLHHALTFIKLGC
eukprot:Hpha_TRINITY_DN15415_c2_g10::TRINITY_DN15415_c2_g10_i1::g.175549::m.175549